MRRPKIKETLGGVAAFAVLLSFIGFIIRAIDKVRTGQGLDYYLTGYGVQMNYLGALIAIAIIPVAMLVGWIIQIYLKRSKTR